MMQAPKGYCMEEVTKPSDTVKCYFNNEAVRNGMLKRLTPNACRLSP